MIDEGYMCWDECPEFYDCELILSFMELVDAMIKDIQHLKAETIRARYKYSQLIDPDKEWVTALDILSNLDMPHYENLAYKEYMIRYYNGGDPMSFKTFIDSMAKLAVGIDAGNY